MIISIVMGIFLKELPMNIIIVAMSKSIVEVMIWVDVTGKLKGFVVGGSSNDTKK